MILPTEPRSSRPSRPPRLWMMGACFCFAFALLSPLEAAYAQTHELRESLAKRRREIDRATKRWHGLRRGRSPARRATGKRPSAVKCKSIPAIADGRFYGPCYEHVAEASKANGGLDPAFLAAIISVESRGNPAALSSAGAMSCMQLMPGTAEGMSVNDPWDPRQNVLGGARYLRWLERRLSGHVPAHLGLWRIVAAYNTGHVPIIEAGGRVPYRATLSYVLEIKDCYEESRKQLERTGPPRGEARPGAVPF